MRLAQIDPSDTGVHETGSAAYGGGLTGDIGDYVGTFVLTPLFSVLGLIFFLLKIYSGIMWMTAAGNPDRVGKAKRILVASVIGLSIVMLALGITYFILDAFILGTSSI